MTSADLVDTHHEMKRYVSFMRTHTKFSCYFIQCLALFDIWSQDYTLLTETIKET